MTQMMALDDFILFETLYSKGMETASIQSPLFHFDKADAKANQSGAL